MTPERLKQADELAEEALKRSPDERAGFLHEACAGDEELRRAAESLLAYDSRAGSFLQEPAFKPTDALIEADRAGSLVGRRIGHYGINSEIGRGGIGDVYLARDTSLDRRVALKLLPADFMADAERVRRFTQEAVGKALELDGELAEAHAALGWVKHFNWEWAEAEREFKLAIELNPSHANAHLFYAGFLATRGRLEEAIAEVDRAKELDPLSLIMSTQRGFILENAHRYDEAIEQLRRVLAMDQDHYVAHWYLGHTYAASGRFNEGIAASEKAAALSRRAPGALGFLGLAYGLGGRKDEPTKC